MADYLSAKFKNSFAYTTVKDRMPIILTKVIDTVYRQRHDILAHYGEKGVEHLKAITSALSELRYRMTTDKPFLFIEGSRKDVKIWNELLKEQELKMGAADFSWFKGPWLISECYMYRKIIEAFDCGEPLRHFDPFRFQKEEAFISSLPLMSHAAEFLQNFIKKVQINPDKIEITKDVFATFLQLSLWGNKFDLSMSSGNVVQHAQSPLEHAQELHPFILCDDSSATYDYLVRTSKNGHTRRIDIVLDNAGMELFGDFCLAEYFLTIQLCDYVVFHVKSMPWFVSDTTHSDFSWTLEMLRGSHIPVLNHFGHLWQQRRDQAQFRVIEHDFWTTAHPFNEMKRVAHELYEELAKPKLVIFKGDLNYRKLVGDLNWPHDTELRTALRGFEPAPLLSLRTLKSHVAVGIDEEIVKKTAALHPDWLINGEYAIIQFNYSSKKCVESKI